MFYDALKGDHGLPHDPFKAIVAPRPVGWISAVNAKGEVNLSPYSFFNAVSDRPHMVMFSSDGIKDAAAFAEETGEFVCNLVSFDQREAMNATSAPLPRGTSEMEHAGIAAAPSVLVRPPRVAAAAAALECKHLRTVSLDPLGGGPARYHMIIGQVVGVYIADEALTDGLFDTARVRPIARAGYHDYFVATGETKFSLRRPPGG
ncbi:MAG TPA: flavin reductase family protein [Beijerinckiaceae bacterium]|jgi:flavin reductase (DIM6/NTAB) family NADH-FMN oxidoreductase RutF